MGESRRHRPSPSCDHRRPAAGGFPASDLGCPAGPAERGGRMTGGQRLILGIETSCDETAASVLLFENPGESPVSPRVLSDVVASQYDLHGRFGGVVPELASRRHVEMIEPVLRAALEDAGVSLGDIGAVAVTRGPGLVIALLVGLSAAKAIAWSRGIPLVGVHHLAGHIYSLFLGGSGPEETSGAAGGAPPFPPLAL